MLGEQKLHLRHETYVFYVMRKQKLLFGQMIFVDVAIHWIGLVKTRK